MTTCTTDKNQLPRFAQTLADQAAEILIRAYRTPLSIEKKQDCSPVSEIDILLERTLREAIRTQYPDHGILGEELGVENADAAYTWVLDPIDGTCAFISGKPTFGVLIALLHLGKPILGIIEHPILKERWVGSLDCPSSLNDMRCYTSGCQALHQARLAATSPAMFRAGLEWETFAALCKQVAYVGYGGDCYNYGLLASGHLDIVMEADLKRYDYMALVPIIEGSGGCISNWQGEALSFTSADSQILATANPTLHQQALALINASEAC